MIKKIKHFFHYLLVPNEHNNYRAKVIHHDALTAYIVVAFLLVFSNRYLGASFGNVLGLATDITVEKLYQYTNDQRKHNGAPSLQYSQKLAKAAQLKAQNMFSQNYWAHFGPNGESPWQFMLESDYQYEVAGENLAKNFLFSRNVITAWMNSPTHKENLLRGDYTEVGFAVVNGVLEGEQTTLVVQMFGKPLENAQAQRKNDVVKSLPSREIVLAETTDRPWVKLPFTSVQLTTAFIAFLLLVFSVDFYVASKLKLVRMHGKSLAHFIFLVTVVSGMIFMLSKGSII